MSSLVKGHYEEDFVIKQLRVTTSTTTQISRTFNPSFHVSAKDCIPSCGQTMHYSACTGVLHGFTSWKVLRGLATLRTLSRTIPGASFSRRETNAHQRQNPIRP